MIKYFLNKNVNMEKIKYLFNNLNIIEQKLLLLELNKIVDNSINSIIYPNIESPIDIMKKIANDIYIKQKMIKVFG